MLKSQGFSSMFQNLVKTSLATSVTVKEFAGALSPSTLLASLYGLPQAHRDKEVQEEGVQFATHISWPLAKYFAYWTDLPRRRNRKYPLPLDNNPSQSPSTAAVLQDAASAEAVPTFPDLTRKRIEYGVPFCSSISHSLYLSLFVYPSLHLSLYIYICCRVNNLAIFWPF